MTKVYLIRHAESEANVAHIIGTDAPLSDKGRQQAAEAGLADELKPDVVMSSALKRAIATAEILFPETYAHVTLPIFNEIFFGDLENLPFTMDIKRATCEDPLILKDKYNGDNGWERAQTAIDFIGGLGTAYPGRTVAIVTSNTLMQFIICLLKYGRAGGYIWSGKLHVNNCRYIEFDVTESSLQLLYGD
ncbi:MAG: histidine phosphatase family protein [Lachnospiraceae bacterium]|nr:histidine phosphatase family protein [Lachnospiraceae bacterium]